MKKTNTAEKMPLSNVQRKKKYIENLKINGYYDAFKKKRAEDEKARRQRLKNSVATLSFREREQALSENRLKNRERAKKFRVRKRIAAETPKNSELLNSSSCESSKIEVLSENSSNYHELSKSTERRNTPSSESSKILSEYELKRSDRTASTDSTETSQQQYYTSCANPVQPKHIEPQNFSSCGIPKIKVLSESLLKCHKRSKKIPERKKKVASKQRNYSSCESSEMDLPQSSYTSLHFEHSYKTYGDLAKDVAKTKRTLPASPSKRNAVIATLFYSLDEKIQQEIIRKKTTLKKVGKKGISTTLFEKIQSFYERDDISRMSRNVEDLINFVNPMNGQREIKHIRNLIVTLKQAYEMFMAENEGEATVKLAKFCSLRPEHVKLCGEKYSFLNKQSHNLNVDREYINSKANVMESLLHVNFVESDDEVQHQVIMKSEPSSNCNIDREYSNSKAYVSESPRQIDYAENESQSDVLPAHWNQHQIFGTCLPICLPPTYPPPTSPPRRKPSSIRTKAFDQHASMPVRLRTNTLTYQPRDQPTNE